MPIVRKETIAIVEATREEVNARHAELMLRMWHHLLPYPERDVLFIDFDRTGQSSTLIQALLIDSRKRARGDWPRMLRPEGLYEAHLPLLERAFRRSLVDVLGRTAAPMVVNAWCEMMRAYLISICRKSA